jgi:hypothetical protein
VRVPLSGPLQHLDRHWLLNHPVLWIMRFQWMIYLWLLGLVLICLAALVLPAPLSAARSLTTYFWAVVALAGLALSPWAYLQARFAPKLRQNSQAQTAVYLLAGYLIIISLYVAWPYAFAHIREARISNKMSERQLREDFRVAATIKDDSESLIEVGITGLSPKYKLQVLTTLWRKYQGKELKLDLDERNLGTKFYIIADDIQDSIRALSAIKGVDGLGPRLRMVFHAGNIYRESVVLASIEVFILLLVLILRIFQATNGKCLLSTIFFGVCVGIALALYESSTLPWKNVVTFGALLLLFAAGGYAVFLAPYLRKKSVLFATGINIFFLLLAWMPVLLRSLARSTGYIFLWERSYDDLGSMEISLFLLGIVILFALTPWIQRRYLALMAKPS